MALSAPSAGRDEFHSQINTTPLVDVMLVLLIIFLITIPVVIHTVPVELPRGRSVPSQPRPETVVIAVDRDGLLYWNNQPVAPAALAGRLAAAAAAAPRLEVQIRGDRAARYEHVGRVLAACRSAGITGVSFMTEPGPSPHE